MSYVLILYIIFAGKEVTQTIQVDTSFISPQSCEQAGELFKQGWLERDDVFDVIPVCQEGGNS